MAAIERKLALLCMANSDYSMIQWVSTTIIPIIVLLRNLSKIFITRELRADVCINKLKRKWGTFNMISFQKLELMIIKQHSFDTMMDCLMKQHFFKEH